MERNSKKKIFFIIPSLKGGGAEKVMVQLLHRMDFCRYEVTILVFHEEQLSKNFLPAKVKVIFFNKKKQGDFFRIIAQYRQMIRIHQPHIVFSALYYANIVTVLGILFLAEKPQVYVAEHSYPKKYLREVRWGWFKKILMAFSYKRADQVVAVSRAIKASLVKDIGIKESDVTVIYNPVPLKDIEVQSKEEVRHKFFDEKNVVLISVGRLEKVKRFDRSMKVVASLKNCIQNIRFLILGEGSLHNELKKLAKKWKIEDIVDFIGFQSNPYPWIRKSDIFLLSSDYEGFPLSLLESLACETPVVSVDCFSGPNEVITDGVNGRLVPLSEGALTEALSKLIQDSKQRNRLSKNGRDRVKEFDINLIMRQYEKLFKKKKF